ncbi:NUAK SNF1-like kinase 1 [Physocladia obscura]|uniref:NUAK SNF1-like kinase 1 n=1 Tax=Physocladia obscura TaxID=109957 RepID=A0AAD5T8H2_9FUNG|nr:NUAK SNF1-like kinase 1 [Physocladia obscura]
MFKIFIIHHRRTFVKPQDIAVNDTIYFDEDIDDFDSSTIAKLATKIRPKRSYSVPWSATDPLGFSPSSDKSHAAYLKTFCDDAARILAESILKHYVQSSNRKESDYLILEISRQWDFMNAYAADFVGRNDILKSIRMFLETNDKENIFILYGQSGIGKSSIIAKVVQELSNSSSFAVISRFVGKTYESSSLRSLLSSVCIQISRIYGIEELRAKITEEIESLSGLVDNTPGASAASEELFDILEYWPPTSMAGLKLGLKFAMSLASVETPLVLVLDGLSDLNNEIDASNIDWLPTILPPNVKVIITAVPASSKKHSLFVSLPSKYPATGVSEISIDDPEALVTYAKYCEVPALSSAEISSLISILLASNQRSLAPDQQSFFTAKSKSSSMPLYVKTAWNLFVRKWTSGYNSIERDLQAETINGLFDDYLERCEGKFGKVFVSRSLGYLTAARNGLSRNELTDILSCDGDVLGELFKAHEPTISRLNLVIVESLLEKLNGCFINKNIKGISVLFWSSSYFKSVATERYLYGERQTHIHKSLANYWRDKFGKEASNKAAKHYVFNQSLLIYGKPNDRRISSIAWHLLNCGVSGFTEAVKTLQNISYLGAAIDAGLLDEVLDCFKFALDNMGNNIYAAHCFDITDYRFLVVNYNALTKTPRALIPLAANLYTSSVVSGDVRSWIKAQAPELNWAEWINRPTSRGEPIAVLRDHTDESFQEITVTCRDTYSNLISVVGIVNSDGISTLNIYEISNNSSSVLPKERGKLFNRINVKIEDDEVGMPLVCCFSRSGKSIAVASRSLTFYSTSDLTLLGHVVDPTLPEGDIITAVTWTKDDGCIVTASDGSEPGRIVLWDAHSFSLLRVVKSQYPRQPICWAYSTIGFWDEYRELFILLDVDELASDAESGLFLQYIPTKSHCNPPADGCARFALAHKASLVLVANDDGLGYMLIDYRAKKPVGRVEIEIDTVRYVSISSDGTKIAIVPHEGKVIHILGVSESHNAESGKNENNEADRDLVLFGYLGTILGSDVEQPSCIFSRNRMTILTDGEFGSTQVWSVNDLGDHSTVRYYSLLPALAQGLSPVMNTPACVGWAIAENRTEVSLSDSKAKAKVRSFDVSFDDDKYGQNAVARDILVALAGHPEKPFTVVVTDLGYLSLLYNDTISVDSRRWITGLWNSKKVGEGLVATYNIWKDDSYTSPTCVAFVLNSGVNQPPNINGTPVEYLTFATGHEDGSLRVWEWSSLAEDLILAKNVNLKFGRITSLVPAGSGSKSMAVTVDDSTVVIWDGVSKDTRSLAVLISPDDVSASPTDRTSFGGSKLRHSSSSVWSSSGISDQKINRPTVIAFSNYSDKLVATGDSNGSVVIWSLEAKTKRLLITHPDKIASFIAIMAICWSADDGTVVSLCEDKRITIHGADTGELIWIHDIWMISPQLKVASFVTGARQLSLIDIYGSFTLVNLHGKWPASKSAGNKTRLGALRSVISTSASRISNILSTNGNITESHPITTSGIYSEPQDLEGFVIHDWSARIAGKLSQVRVDLNTRSSDVWQYTTGSGSHGHVALLLLDTGLPRGTFEVICEVDIPESFNTPSLRATNQIGIPLQFVCGITDSNHEDHKLVVDPELEVIRGFTRYVPVEEQKQLAGLGSVNLRLGFIKTLSYINTCYIDLKRIPGDGEVFKLGTVNFIPVDPSLYSPVYKPPADLKSAFESTGRKFRDFEARHRRRSSILNSVVSERMSATASVPDLKAALIRASTYADEETDSVEVNQEIALAVPTVTAPQTPASLAAKAGFSRLSMLQPFSKNIADVVSNVSGLLTPRTPATPATFEDIQREMAEARKKANEEAKLLEEEEEALALAATKEREARALRAEFERNAKESIAKMVKGTEIDYSDKVTVGGEYLDEFESELEAAEFEKYEASSHFVDSQNENQETIEENFFSENEILDQIYDNSTEVPDYLDGEILNQIRENVSRTEYYSAEDAETRLYESKIQIENENIFADAVIVEQQAVVGKEVEISGRDVFVVSAIVAVENSEIEEKLENYTKQLPVDDEEKYSSERNLFTVSTVEVEVDFIENAGIGKALENDGVEFSVTDENSDSYVENVFSSSVEPSNFFRNYDLSTAIEGVNPNVEVAIDTSLLIAETETSGISEDFDSSIKLERKIVEEQELIETASSLGNYAPPAALESDSVEKVEDIYSSLLPIAKTDTTNILDESKPINEYNAFEIHISEADKIEHFTSPITDRPNSILDTEIAIGSLPNSDNAADEVEIDGFLEINTSKIFTNSGEEILLENFMAETYTSDIENNYFSEDSAQVLAFSNSAQEVNTGVKISQQELVEFNDHESSENATFEAAQSDGHAEIIETDQNFDFDYLDEDDSSTEAIETENIGMIPNKTLNTNERNGSPINKTNPEIEIRDAVVVAEIETSKDESEVEMTQSSPLSEDVLDDVEGESETQVDDSNQKKVDNILTGLADESQQSTAITTANVMAEDYSAEDIIQNNETANDYLNVKELNDKNSESIGFENVVEEILDNPTEIENETYFLQIPEEKKKERSSRFASLLEREAEMSAPNPLPTSISVPEFVVGSSSPSLRSNKHQNRLEQINENFEFEPKESSFHRNQIISEICHERAPAPNHTESEATLAEEPQRPLLLPQNVSNSEPHQLPQYQQYFDPEHQQSLPLGIHVGDYILTDTIGEGTFGKVKLGIHFQSGETFAVKSIQKSKIKTVKQMNSVQREVRLMKMLKHPHIVDVKETLEDGDQIFIVMELASGGELFDYIAKQCQQDENMARAYFRQVVSAINYCHQNSIIHRDLKPENLLLDKSGNIKIIDFGFGNTFHRDRTLDTYCGSPYYAAPEMVKGIPYTGPEVDIWSMGVILYVLITGNLPFDSRDMPVLYSLIAKGEYDSIKTSDSEL